MSVERRISLFLLVLVFSFGLANSAFAQEQRERTLDEIKTEAIKRAENGMYPLIGLDPADIREAFAATRRRTTMNGLRLSPRLPTVKDKWVISEYAVTRAQSPKSQGWPPPVWPTRWQWGNRLYGLMAAFWPTDQ